MPPPSSPDPASVSQVLDMLGKHVPLPQQLTPGAEPHAVSHSELTLQFAVHEVLLSSPPELFPPELLSLLVEASGVFLAVNPGGLLFELPQATTKPTAVRPIVRLRIEPIFIWRLPSAAPNFGAHNSV